MEIKQIKEKKKMLEHELFGLLKAFEEETSVIVSGIYLDRINIVGATHGRLHKITLEVVI